MATQVTLSFENINNNGIPCKNPVIIITGSQGDIAYPCGNKIDDDGNIKLTIQESDFVGSCISGVIKCDECSHCPEVEFEACLCNTSADCEACQECVNGVCINICKSTEKCVNNTCCECETTGDCGPGFYCNGCKCVCNGKVNSRGECVECLGKSDCSSCQDCINGSCEDIVCPNNLICIGDGCGCPPKTRYDANSMSCVPEDECSKDSDCGECETCVAGVCQEITCPKDHKCVGGECIYWPCSNTSCSNGADCGKDCGCLNGECVPCYILECLGECQNALGCKCNDNLECVPVDNCGQYCDGNTPCLDANCTCYNNTCVSCENFPCNPDECSDKYNCGCQGGDCKGGNGCNDTFELKKNENCTADGCELEAVYSTTNKCACDPIEFKVKNIYPTATSGPGNDGGGGNALTLPSNKFMELNVRLFKNNIPYENFKNVATMSDTELVDATIRTTITHEVDGDVVNVNATPVNTVSVDSANKVPNIVINNNNVIRQFNGKGTVVKIEVRAENIKVNDNSCINYGSKVIAIYELDFRTASSTANTLAKLTSTFAAEVSQKVNDNTSSRKPLFVWYKSNTGEFGNTRYTNNGTYNQNGYFRKFYAIKTSTGWTDKVSNPAKQVTANQKNELWNNLNYFVKVDCGCGGGNGATLQNVIFCCTENINYTISNCGKTITVPPFDVCSVNKNLTALNTTGYTIPQEAQTYFWLVINGDTEVLLRTEGGEIINSPFVYNHDTNISTVTFLQRYKGTPNVAESCEVDYTEDYEGPDYNVNASCGSVVVTKQASSPAIQSVTGKKGTSTITFTPSAANTIWTATGGVLNMNGEVEVTVNFQNSCTFTKKVSIVCQPEIIAEPTDTFARGECVGGENPDVVVSVVTGFSSAVKFSKDGITYVNPDSTSPTIQKTFEDFAAGTYTFYAKETINGVDVIDTQVVTIAPMVNPTVVKTDICGNTQGSITLVNAAPSSTWKIFGPAFNGFTITVGSGGSSSPVQVPIDKNGQYVIKLVTDPSNSTCPEDLTIDINKDGGAITPVVTMSSVIICNDGELFLRIDDGGLNLTYNVQLSSAQAGVLTDLSGNTISTLQANNTGTYNAKIKGSNSTGSTAIYNFVITGVSGNACYSLSSPTITKSFSVQPGPKIGIITASCDNACQRDCYTISVAVSGHVTSVVIGGVAATNIGGGIWQADVQTLTPPLIEAYSSLAGCSDSEQMTVLPDCDGRAQCPEQTVVISANPASPTCGVQTVSLYYVYSTLGNIDGESYAWYKNTNGIMQLITSGVISGTPPQLDVLSSFTNEDYILVITTNNGICEYTSNVETVYADTELAPEIFGAGILPDTTILVTGQTYSYSTGFVPGATYTWTLSNTAGTDQPIGTNSNAISISSFVDGPNIINLTVTNGVCTGSTSVTLDVGLSCPQITLGLTGSGSNTCRGIAAVIVPETIPPGVTVSSYAWYIGGSMSSQSGTFPIVNFDSSEIEAGAEEDITIRITFSNGCTAESSALTYTRCSCICDGSATCTDEALFTGFDQSGEVVEIGPYPAGTVLTFRTSTNSNGQLFKTDRFRMYVDNGGSTLLLDTGYIYDVYSAGSCPETNYPGDLVDLSGETAGSGLPISDVTANMLTALPAVGDVEYLSDISMELQFSYTTNVGDVIRFLVNDASCSNQQSWRIEIDCAP